MPPVEFLQLCSYMELSFRIKRRSGATKGAKLNGRQFLLLTHVHAYSNPTSVNLGNILL